MTTGSGFALTIIITLAILVAAGIGGHAGMDARDRWAMWFRRNGSK